MLAELRRVADLIDARAIRRDAFDRVSLLTSDTIVRRFGGWGAALAKAGLGDRYGGPVVTEGMRRKPARGLTERQLLARLRRIARRDGVVTQAMLARKTSMCAQTYAKRFGTWSTALRLAGLRLSNWSSATAEARAARAHARSAGTGPGGENPATRRYVPYQLRFKVLKRDDYRCQLCGDSPAITRGTLLEVDHIHPFSQGGRTTEDNLRTLCRRCNQGKGARS